MYERVRQEIELLKNKYPNLVHGEQLSWVLIPKYKLPAGRFNKGGTKLLFVLPAGYPNTGIDNFFVDVDLRLHDGGNPSGFNIGSNSSSGAAPIAGDWAWFSWHPAEWRPAATVEAGDNLLTFLHGVNLCLQGQETT
ncbi:MAG: hypothetical protein IT331_23450 [Anaerolineae bacterium]|nr:hypothetical protein [Anaerolineae bacterium]